MNFQCFILKLSRQDNKIRDKEKENLLIYKAVELKKEAMMLYCPNLYSNAYLNASIFITYNVNNVY